jgi:hypothetical protein
MSPFSTNSEPTYPICRTIQSQSPCCINDGWLVLLWVGYVNVGSLMLRYGSQINAVLCFYNHIKHTMQCSNRVLVSALTGRLTIGATGAGDFGTVGDQIDK